ncbi:FAD binding domain-containing protein [Streptomyces inhibens]|uniref:FAD binding domain-containing protein n=1 Tax=Streptomyces inhibens TaxID=2293571 RepID=UPI002479719F|nr:FAD binding domain-containing protein [Streptomyces inhibens]UKY47622.1 FAD binding domain-containing protein [Streptomyces inhibens]
MTREADSHDLLDGGPHSGALARRSDVAQAPVVVQCFPVLAQALVLGASAHLRNMASMGGNLMQRVRCSSFHDPESACNKRVPGDGCATLEGINHGHAVLGTCCREPAHRPPVRPPLPLPLRLGGGRHAKRISVPTDCFRAAATTRAAAAASCTATPTDL